MNNRLVVLALGVLLLLASFWVKDAFAIQLYDTYFVIGWGLILRSVGLLCCLVGGLYLLGNRSVNQQ